MPWEPCASCDGWGIAVGSESIGRMGDMLQVRPETILHSSIWSDRILSVSRSDSRGCAEGDQGLRASQHHGDRGQGAPHDQRRWIGRSRGVTSEETLREPETSGGACQEECQTRWALKVVPLRLAIFVKILYSQEIQGPHWGLRNQGTPKIDPQIVGSPCSKDPSNVPQSRKPPY